MNSQLSKLSVRLIFNNLKLFSVESCSGGWIGKAITDIEGSSSWYQGGLITYSNESKTKLANVSEQLIEKHGAVSIEVAEAMALGGHSYFPDGISVAVTGIAGPGGGTQEKPVGTVCIACQYKNTVKSRRFQFSGDRQQVRLQTVQQALDLVLSLNFNLTQKV